MAGAWSGQGDGPSTIVVVNIHSEDPFAIPVEQRDPVRRLRGRLAAPVTVVTAQDARPAGLTVSSFFVVEGDIPRAVALVGRGSDFMDAVEASGSFVAHILTEDDHKIADVFAGHRPSPGGMFASVSVADTDWGPRIASVGDWAGCRLEDVRPLGDQLLVIGEIDELSVSDLVHPLVYFRGSYRGLS